MWKKNRNHSFFFKSWALTCCETNSCCWVDFKTLDLFLLQELANRLFFHHNSQQANNSVEVDSEGHENGDDDIEDVVHDADVDEDDEDLFFH